MGEVFITKVGRFLPGDPVDNEGMSAYISELDQGHKLAKRMTLRNNKIKQRYYAIDPLSGKTLFTNARMAAEAIRMLQDAHFSIDDIELLACGTSSADQILPSHTSMVHGELKNPSCEIAGISGICCAGVFAIKYGYLSILSGQCSNAVASGSELLSTLMTDKNFTVSIGESRLEGLEKEPIYAFDSAFLRWMLSDGAGALLMEDKPRADGVSLKIEWIDVISYADKYDTCMYAGARKMEDGSLNGWREYDLTEADAKELFAIKQDVKLLNANMVRLGIKEHHNSLKEKRNLKPEEVDYYLPHLSSNYFKQEVYRLLQEIGFELPFEKWFTNLSYVGNVGSASIYLMLEEIMRTGVPYLDENGLVDETRARRPLQKGQKILCEIPESGRFSNALMLLTVV